MHALNQWYVFHDGMKPDILKKIRQKGGTWNWEVSGVDIKKEVTQKDREDGREREIGVDKKTRVSDIKWINDQWVFDTIWPWMQQANEHAGWKYHIDAAEAVQLTRYKVGGFYSWHQDGNNCHLSAYKEGNEFVFGKVRKLSMTILMNDDFEGGEFEIMTYSKGEKQVEQPFENPKAGQIIVFPSSMEHRVKPVKRGVRHSLVVWFLGPPMK